MPEDAGALLVRSGLIASEQLRIAREAQASRGGTVGEHLVLAGLIDDETLTDFYRTRLMVPQVRAEQLASISSAIIAKIPADMATEFRCIPVSCDRDRNLTLAMADPSTTHTVDEISFFTGHYVIRAVATQSQIAWCLAHYYGHLTPLGEKLLAGTGAQVLVGQAVGQNIGQDLGQDLGQDIGQNLGQTRRQSLSLPLPPDAAPEAAASATPSAARRITSTDPGHERVDFAADAGHAFEDEDAAVPMVIESDRPTPPPNVAYHVPPEPDQPYISFLREDTAPTGPIRAVRRHTTQPPELAARAGELDVHTGPIHLLDERLPAVMVSPTLELVAPRHLAGLDDDVTGPLPPVGPAPAHSGEPVPGYAPRLSSGSSELAELAEPAESSGPAERSDRHPDTWPGTEHGHTPDFMPASDWDHEPTQPPTWTAADDLAMADGDDAREGVVLLDRPKSTRLRRHRSTRLGLGIGAADSDRHAAAGEDLDEGAHTGEMPAIPMEAPDSRPAPWPAHAPRPTPRPTFEPQDSIQTAARVAAEEYGRAFPGAGTDTGQVQAEEAVPDIIHDDRSRRDREERSGKAGRRAGKSGRQAELTPPPLRHDDELSDEHWGPPGSTIPPEYLGPARPEHFDSGPEPIPLIADHLSGDFDEADIARVLGNRFDTPGAASSPPTPAPLGNEAFAAPGPAHAMTPADAAAIAFHRTGQVSSDGIRIVESEPMRALPAGAGSSMPAAGERRMPISGPSLSFHNSDPMTPEVMRELEESSLRLVEILRDLDQADSRNEVIDTLIEHLAESHERVAFFVVKAGELTTWKQRIGGNPIEKQDGVKLSLDEPSTFQDIVGTRLPFRGPLTDPVSRAFTAAALDHSAGEMLALPVSVRGRVVGVLYGDTCAGRVFEQHLAVVTRAAGVALERILRAKKNA